MKKFALRAIGAALIMAGVTATTFAAPIPAAAEDVGTDAALGAAAGVLVGSLLFDNNRGQYYYVQGYHRHYVHHEYAQRWFSYHDRGFYHRHEGEFYHNPGRFNHEWHDHHGWNR